MALEMSGQRLVVTGGAALAAAIGAGADVLVIDDLRHA